MVRRAGLCLTVAALVLAAAPARGEPQPSPLETVMARAAQSQELQHLVTEVRRAARAGRRPVVVFDVDDTLIRWRRMGGQAVSFGEMPGAVDYVRALDAAGARIVYLTGRTERLRRPTERLLRRLGLPLDPAHGLWMRRGTGSVLMSKARARRWVLALGTPVALFDNDLANVRLFRRQYPRARVFRVAGHSGTGDPAPGRGTDGIRVVTDLARAPGRVVRFRPAAGRGRAFRGGRDRLRRDRAARGRRTGRAPREPARVRW